MVTIYETDDGTEYGYGAPNGSGPAGHQSESSPRNSGDPGRSAGPDFDVILGAPDLAELMRKPRNTPTANEYKKKTASVLRTVTVGAIAAQNLPDAATLLYHGPGLATSVGNLADHSEMARKAVDMLTAPDNPWLVFAFTLIPMASQIMRNHEEQLTELPARWAMGKKARKARADAKAGKVKSEPRFTVKLPFGRSIPIRFKFNFKLAKALKGIHSSTYDPSELTYGVFSDPALGKELEKYGITVQLRPRP
jgi:hypothetical protein